MTTQLPQRRYLWAKRVGVGILCVACVIVLLGLVLPIFGPFFWGRGRPRPNLAPTDTFLSSVTLPIDSRLYRPQQICLKTDDESSVQDSIWDYSLTKAEDRVTLSLSQHDGDRGTSFHLNPGDIIPLGNQLYSFTSVADHSMRVRMVTNAVPGSYHGRPSSVYLCLNSDPRALSLEQITDNYGRKHEVFSEAKIDEIVVNPLSAKITLRPMYSIAVPQESRTKGVESHILHPGDSLGNRRHKYRVGNIVAPIDLGEGRLVGWVELSAIRP